MAAGNLKNVRVDDDVWTRAGARASDEGTDRSELIRQWLANYAETGSPDGKRPRIRLTAAERKAAREAVASMAPDILEAVLQGANSQR